MKTFVYFIFTCFISTGCMIGALNAPNPYPMFIVAFGIWGLFLWGWNKRMKRETEREHRERLFDEFLKSKLRKRKN